MSYAEKVEQLQKLRAEVRRLERLAEAEAKRMGPLTEADERRMTEMQARADEAYTAAGRRAPPPTPLERPDEYRRRLADGVKIYSPRWQKADLQAVPEDALAVLENQIYADAATHGRTHGLKLRQIKPIENSHQPPVIPRLNMSAAPKRPLFGNSSGWPAARHAQGAGRICNKMSKRREYNADRQAYSYYAPAAAGAARRVLIEFDGGAISSPRLSSRRLVGSGF